MRTVVVVVLWSVACLANVRGAATTVSLEKQFRADCETVIRASWPPKDIRDDAVAKVVEEMLADAKRTFPTLLAEYSDREVLKDDALQALYAKLINVRGEGPSAPLFSFYLKRWKSRSLTLEHTILFERIFHLLIDDVQKNKG